MKKFVTAVAVVALVAFAAPVFAATNPFMDVPMNHWAYDAIGQLAAHGILSGYPDGLYKGKQPTTRYEMASALARALAVVDMTKASKQDVEMLQKLVVEFHDELEALGVRVDDIEGKVNLLDSRLGGWKLSGEFRLDVMNESANNAKDGTSDGSVDSTRMRIHFDRWFGDPENPMHFRATLNGEAAAFKHFYFEVPFFWDTLMTVGKVSHNWESAYYYGGTSTGGWDGLGAAITDRDLHKFQIDKQFGMGKVSAYVAHPSTGSYKDRNDNTRYWFGEPGVGAWELALAGQFQFNEQFGFDIGAQAFFGDNAEADPATVWAYDANGNLDGSRRFKDMYTIFAGLRFNFNDNVAFKGIFYYQKRHIDYYLNNAANVPAWREWDIPTADKPEEDSSNRWSVMLDVKQEALKFTSLWLEYGQVQKDFVSPSGTYDGHFFGTKYLPDYIDHDMKFFRIALAQEWNEKWSTHLFYYGYKRDGLTAAEERFFDDMSEWGLGVQYKYNPNVTFGLNFVQADKGQKKDMTNAASEWSDKDNIVRFRTKITF